MVAATLFVIVAMIVTAQSEGQESDSTRVSLTSEPAVANDSADPVGLYEAQDPFHSPLPTWQFGPRTTLHIRGRVDTDFIATSQSAANKATFGDLGDTVGLRRARIGVEGLLPNGHYIAELDFASGEVVVRDLFVGFGDVKERGEYRFGHFREPFSFEGGTSANTFAFMERSPINVLDPARNWGFALFRANVDDTATLALGAFHSGTDAGDFQGGDGSTVGITERLTYTPIHESDEGRLLHLGIALSERIPENGVIIVNQQPRSPLLYLGDSANSPFVPVIEIPASYQQLMNLQLALARGSVWAQAEWYGSWIDQTGGRPVFFHGSYAACGWFITGEHRGYPGANGGLGAVHVNHPFLKHPFQHDRERGWGGWELVARFSYLDFFDSNTPLGPTGQLVGIKLPETTLGVNWYLSDYVRLMFNYNYALPDEPNVGPSVSNTFAMRLGVFW